MDMFHIFWGFSAAPGVFPAVELTAFRRCDQAKT
jgi:hypothetical protein